MGGELGSVLIVDDHDLLAEALALALRVADIADVHVTEPELDPGAIRRVADEVDPDVVLISIDLVARSSSVPLVGQLVDTGATVLLLTGGRDRWAVAEGVEAGAAGVILRLLPLDTMLEMVQHALEGRCVMSPSARHELLRELRERNEAAGRFADLTNVEAQVMALLVEGLSAEEIANRRYVALNTVRSEIKTILKKLDVHSQREATALARSSDWPPT